MRFDFNKPPSERLIIGIVGFLGIAVLILGTLQIKKGIEGPFRKNIAQERNTQNSVDMEQINKLAELQKKDTDKDGLSDYDELYVYRTSPYLRDSDSDGIDDKTEIDQGTDPNCPKGQDCGLPVAAPVNLNASTNSFTEAPVNGSNSNQSLNDKTLSGNLSPAELRQILISSGAPENVVKGLSDDDLLKLYKEVAANQQLPANNNSASSSAPAIGNANAAIDVTKLSPADLEKLTPAEIRNLMAQFGVAKETLDQVDDATLRTIFLQALQQQKQ